VSLAASGAFSSAEGPFLPGPTFYSIILLNMNKNIAEDDLFMFPIEHQVLKRGTENTKLSECFNLKQNSASQNEAGVLVLRRSEAALRETPTPKSCESPKGPIRWRAETGKRRLAWSPSANLDNPKQ
jgi:hypothetical protein